jgi:hypothetical protein
MEIKTWDIEDIERKIKEEEKRIEDKSSIRYEDSYYQQSNNYCAFNGLAGLMSCSVDYSDRSVMKIDTVEGLKDKLKNDLDVSMISTLERRLSNLTFQHPMEK